MSNGFALWMTLMFAQCPVVEQEVAMISVAHMPDHCVRIFFWDDVQGEPACIDHTWAKFTMAISRVGRHWQVEWMDDGDECYRVVRTKIWVESWEPTDPTEWQNKQWVGGLQPGLKQPRR